MPTNGYAAISLFRQPTSLELVTIQSKLSNWNISDAEKERD